MSIQNLGIYLVCVILVTLSPGPDILTVIARSVTQGTRAGLVATLGFAAGLIFHTTIAATGLALVLRQSRAAFAVVQYLGAAYLLFLAVQMVRTKGDLRAQENAARRTLWGIFGQSVLMNVLNPKVTLFFLALLSGFVDQHGALPVALQMVILGAIFAACTIVCFSACALAAGPLTVFLRKQPEAEKPLRYLTAGLFVVLAASLVLVNRPGN